MDNGRVGGDSLSVALTYVRPRVKIRLSFPFVFARIDALPA